MSSVVGSQLVESLHTRYDELIKNYRTLKKNLDSGAPIENTKLWHYKKSWPELMKWICLQSLGFTE